MPPALQDVDKQIMLRLIDREIEKKSGADTTPSRFDAATESTRAQKIGGSAAGMNIDVARSSGTSLRNPGFQMALKSAVDEFDRRKATAQAGVEQDEPLPISGVGVGFSNNPAETIKTELTRNFRGVGNLAPKEDIKMRMGEQSGELEYLNPLNKRWTQVNLDLASKAGFLLPLAGDVSGTIAGGIAMSAGGPAGMLLGETTGSGAGTAVGEMLRLSIGRMMGFNNLSASEIVASSAGQGAEAAAATFVVGGAVVGVKSLKNFIKGDNFTKRAALDSGMKAEQADAVLKEMNSLLNSSNLDNQVLATTAKKTGNINAGALEAEIKSHKDFAERFAAREASDQAGLAAGVDVAGKPFLSGPTPGVEEISKQVGAQVDKRVSQSRAVVARNADDLKKALGGLDSRIPATAGGDIRPSLVIKADLARTAIDDVNDSWRSLTDFSKETGLTGIKLDLTPGIKTLKGRLSRESRQAITTITKQSKGRIFGSLDEGVSQRSEDFLSRWLGEGPRNIDGVSQFDLSDFNIALSDLKRAVRTSSRNGNITDPAIGDMKLAISELQKARNIGLIQTGKKDVLEALLDAESKRAVFAETYERSIVGSLLEKSGAGFKVTDEDILRRIMFSNGDELDVLLRVAGDNPSAMRAIKQGIHGDYKKRVVRNGVPKEDLHNEWLASNSGALKRFFSSSERKEISRLGGLGSVVAKQDKQMVRILREARSKWGKGKLASLDPEKIVDFVSNNSSVIVKPSGAALQVSTKKISWLKNNISKQNWRGFQREYASRIKSQILNDGLLQPKKLEKILETKDVLSAVFGPTYVKNLITIHESAKIVNQGFSRLSGSEFFDAIQQFVRGTEIAPPLSQRGRRFTAGLLFARKVNHERIAEALLDDKLIKDIAVLSTHNTITRETMELSASLGLIFSTD